MNADEKAVAAAMPRTVPPPPISRGRVGEGAMINLSKWVDAPARALMSLLFLLSGFAKLTGVVPTQGYMEAHGVPGILIWPAATWELSAGLLLLVGLGIRPLCVLLAGWCLLTASIFHTAFADQNQT